MWRSSCGKVATERCGIGLPTPCDPDVAGEKGGSGAADSATDAKSGTLFHVSSPPTREPVEARERQPGSSSSEGWAKDAGAAAPTNGTRRPAARPTRQGDGTCAVWWRQTTAPGFVCTSAGAAGTGSAGAASTGAAGAGIAAGAAGGAGAASLGTAADDATACGACATALAAASVAAARQIASSCSSLRRGATKGADVVGQDGTPLVGLSSMSAKAALIQRW